VSVWHLVSNIKRRTCVKGIQEASAEKYVWPLLVRDGIGDWVRVCNQKLNDLYFSPNNIIWVVQPMKMWGGAYAMHGGEEMCDG
jgi:hypothetical protein